MAMRAKGPGAGWSWLMRGFNVPRRDVAKMFGASALFALCLLTPAAIQLVAKPHGIANYVLTGAIALVSAMLYPILMGGFMRMFDASRHERPVRVLMLFDPFRAGQGGARLALFGLCMLLVYALFLILLLTTVGHGMVSWYQQLLDQQSLGVTPPSLPPLPPAASLTFALLTVFFLFYGGAFAIGTGQVALRGEAPLPAFRDGLAGAFKNALPLLVLAISGLLIFVVLAIVIGIVAGIVIVLAALLSKALGIALAAVVYLALILAIYVFMMGVNYAVWDDVANDGQNGLPVRASIPSADA